MTRTGRSTHELSLDELFAVEVESQLESMSLAICALEGDPASAAELEKLMRASHSLKGAARLVERSEMVRLMHAFESRIVLAQSGERPLHTEDFAALVGSCDWVTKGHNLPVHAAEGLVPSSAALIRALESGEPLPGLPPPLTPSPLVRNDPAYLRVNAESMNRLLGFSGEAFVDAAATVRLTQRLGRLRRNVAAANSKTSGKAGEIGLLIEELYDLHSQLEDHSHRMLQRMEALHQEVLNSRMRPIGEIRASLLRVAHDAARSVGKHIVCEIRGDDTAVDREILRELEMPLQHLVRNAVDHGLESPDERGASGKASTGTILVEARRLSRTLQITVEDDGRGLDFDRIRERIRQQALLAPEVLSTLSQDELAEFIFLPGFTSRDEANHLSGRGVGLDIVQNTVRGLHGNLRVAGGSMGGTLFTIEVPLSFAVTAALLVRVSGHLYAFPLTHIAGVGSFSPSEVIECEGRRSATWGEHQIGLVPLQRAIGLAGVPEPDGDSIRVVMLQGSSGYHGIVVDGFAGHEELVLQQLDPRLGRIQDVGGAALLSDGQIAVVLNGDDIVQTIERLSQGEDVTACEVTRKTQRPAKRILVVDDSLTVRELERKILSRSGYTVQLAVDGAEGWNLFSSGGFDLLITDVDMPRMNGIELTRLAKQHPRTAAKPVIIVSYKDREEDRIRGLDAGADYYLTKGSFHDDSFLTAVSDLVGPAPSDGKGRPGAL